MKYSFSGHETFSCKQYWLKKGIDYLQKDKKFTDDHSVVDLGVGKNMVISIRFWLKAFGMIDEKDQATEIAEFLFGEGGADPFLEDTTSLWLLHYHLVKEKRSSIYDLVFNQFRFEKANFTKEQFYKFLDRKIDENNDSFSPKTIEGDVKVFFGNYLTSNKEGIEDGYAGILQELHLLSKSHSLNYEEKNIEWFSLNVSEKDNLPYQIILYSILNNPNFGSTISFRELISNPDSPGAIFLLNEIGLREKIEQIIQSYSTIVSLHVSVK